MRALAVGLFCLLQQSVAVTRTIAALVVALSAAVIIALIGTPASAGPLPKDFFVEPSSAGPPPNLFGSGSSCMISSENFLKLKPGTGYEDAVLQLGCNGTEVGQFVAGLNNAKIFGWNGDTEEHCRLRAIFAPGLVDNPIRPTRRSLEAQYNTGRNGYRCFGYEWDARFPRR